jgi:two-component system sensor histidine kinase QseC
MAVSIRSILIRRLLLATLFLVGGGAWLIYLQVQHETEELFDAQLSRSARLILSLVQADRGHLEFSNIQNFLDQNRLAPEQNSDPDNTLENLFHEGVEELPDGHIYETKLGFQIWDNEGNLLLKSENLPVTEISKTRGFAKTKILGDEWRVFNLTSGDGLYRCITAERIDVRNDLIGKVSGGLALFFVLLVPVLLTTMWFAITHGLQPLQSLTSQIESRGAEKLDSISGANTPLEIKTITDALNQLLSRLGNALNRERRIVSNAAHELRTPLAAVRLHAELASKATNTADRESSIKHVLAGIDRSTHLVNQLLALARLEPETFSERLKVRNLSRILVDEVALLAPQAEEKNITIASNHEQEIMASVDETSIRLLIRNLLSNAINYTPVDGAITLSLHQDKADSVLTIVDNGPGIPVAERERVFDRFYRIQNHEESGCGIGLSIVKHVVELHKATILLEEPENSSGLKVTIRLSESDL